MSYSTHNGFTVKKLISIPICRDYNSKRGCRFSDCKYKHVDNKRKPNNYDSEKSHRRKIQKIETNDQKNYDYIDNKYNDSELHSYVNNALYINDNSLYNNNLSNNNSLINNSLINNNFSNNNQNNNNFSNNNQNNNNNFSNNNQNNNNFSNSSNYVNLLDTNNKNMNNYINDLLTLANQNNYNLLITNNSNPPSNPIMSEIHDIVDSNTKNDILKIQQKIDSFCETSPNRMIKYQIWKKQLKTFDQYLNEKIEYIKNMYNTDMLKNYEKFLSDLKNNHY